MNRSAFSFLGEPLEEDSFLEIEWTERMYPILNSWIRLKDLLNSEAEEIENEMAKLENEIETGELPPRDAEIMIDLLHNPGWVLEQYAEYANLLRRSFVVSACSFLESTLIEVCRPNAEDEVGDYYDEVRHMGDRIQKLLKRLFPGAKRGEIIGEKRWNFLCDLIKVRNVIVHASGNLALVHKNPTPEHLENVVEREPGLDWRPAAFTTELAVYEEYGDKVADLLEFLTRVIFAEQ
jgi:hypothetical protein